MVNEIAAEAGALLFTLGLVGVYRGWKQRGHHALVAETPTTDIRNVSETGVVELDGEVAGTPDDVETFASPVGGEDCVLAGWEVEQRNERGEYDAWEKRATGVRSVPFYLDDGTDRVVVDPGTHEAGDDGGAVFTPERVVASTGVSVGGVTCEFDAFDVVEAVPIDEDPPARVREFVDETDCLPAREAGVDAAVDAGDHRHGDRRYYERALRPGDDVYVLGYVTPATDTPTTPLRPADVAVTPPPEDADADAGFLLSNQSETDLRADLAASYRFSLYGSLVVVALGSGLVAVGFGVDLAGLAAGLLP